MEKQSAALRLFKQIAGLCLALLSLAACTRSLAQGDATVYPTGQAEHVFPTVTATAKTTGAPAPTPTQGTSLIVHATQSPTQTGTTGGAYPSRLAVFNLTKGNVLNVRQEPSVGGKIIETLASDTRDLNPTGKTVEADNLAWVEIKLSAGTGWVSAAFVAEQVPSQPFCADGRVGQLLDQFVLAMRKQDGAALGKLVSPAHGLIVNRAAGSGTPVEITDPGEIANLFTSGSEYDWGTDSASGQPVSGSFKDKVFPELINVLGVSSTRFCNSLKAGQGTGPTSALVAWPADYAALNYVALFRPAPADQEHDWRTWVVGIDYVKNTPYVSVLLQYTWTP